MEEQLLYETLVCLRSHELVRVTLNFGVTPVQFSWREICAFFIVLNILPSYLTLSLFMISRILIPKKKVKKEIKTKLIIYHDELMRHRKAKEISV